MSTPRTVAGLLCAWLAGASPALATVAGEVCPPAADPCVVPQGSTIQVTDGSILDFGTRALVLPSGSGTRISIGSGSVTILAGSLTLNPGSSIDGSPTCPNNPPFPTGGNLTVTVVGDVSVLRDGNRQASIDVSNCAVPGSMRIGAGGTIRVDGILTAQGKQSGAGFGDIDLTATGDVTIPGMISAAGGAESGGGDVFVTAGGEINVSGALDVSGADGGSIALVAGDRILTTVGGLQSRLDARAISGGGSGGILDLQAGGDLTLNSPVHLQGEPSLGFGGDGGELLVVAGQTLALNGPINIYGTVPDGLGGDVDLISQLDIVQTGAIDASGKRSFGAGGFVAMLAKRAVTAGPINARGDCEGCGGGSVELAGWCAVPVPGATTIDSGGSGGSISLQSGGTATIAGTLAGGDAVQILYH